MKGNKCQKSLVRGGFTLGTLIIVSVAILAVYKLYFDGSKHDNIIVNITVNACENNSDHSVLPTAAPTDNICETETCLNVSKLFKQNMDEGLNPCDDFYKFACVNFEKHNPRPGNKGRLTGMDKIGEDVKKELVKALSKKPNSKEAEPIAYIRQLYQKFTDQELLAKNDFSKLIQFQESFENIDGLEEIIINSVLNGVPTLLSFGVGLDPSDTSKRVVMIDGPSFRLSLDDLIADEKDEKAKKVREAYSKFIETTLPWIEILEDVESPPGSSEAKKILNLEIALAKITSKDTRDEKERTRKFKKDTLSQEFPGINLAKIIDEISGETKVDEIIVADIKYFKNLSAVLTVLNNDNVKNYLKWKIIENYGSLVSDKFNNAEFEFLKVNNGLTKKPDRSDECINFLINAAPNVLGRVYIDAVGFGEEDFKRAYQMVENLKKSMENIISEKVWMDNETKKAALAKLKAINKRTNIAYPKWITDDKELTKSFPLKFKSADDAFELTLRLVKSLVTQSINKLNGEIDITHEWPMSPALVDAAYDPTQNSITFPAAILRGVFFDSKRPDYLNYGGIGHVIGHEITHGFDDQGAQYGPDGRLHNWWSEETLKKFKEAANKMIEEYSNIIDETTGLHLNGESTIGENIADNGGMKETYNAYFNQKRNEQLLPGFEDWTPEKLFFLSYANIWCGVITPEDLRNRINTDPHSPAEYRVNIVLKNLKEFSDAYGCKAGDGMNLENRIEVW